MSWLSLALVLASSPAPRELAITHFQVVQLNADLAGFAEDRLARELEQRGYRVITPGALATLLGVERQKQLVGCSENSTSCLAELSAALGMPLIASGRITQLGTRIELDVQVLRQRDAKVVARVARAVDDQAQLGRLMADGAADLVAQLDPPGAASARLWVPLGLGVAAMAGGGLLLGLTQLRYDAYTTPGTTVTFVPAANVQDTFRQLELQRALGWALGGVGLAAVVFGIVWNAVSGEAPPRVALTLTPAGGALSLGGHF